MPIGQGLRVFYVKCFLWSLVMDQIMLFIFFDVDNFKQAKTMNINMYSKILTKLRPKKNVFFLFSTNITVTMCLRSRQHEGLLTMISAITSV